MTAKKKLRPETEALLPLPNDADFPSFFIAPLGDSPRWDRLMKLARDTARMRGERVRVEAGWVDRYMGGRSRWVYVIECASWCKCRKGSQS